MINHELKCKNSVMGIFLDLQKAFDAVNIEILLYRLRDFEIMS